MTHGTRQRTPLRSLVLLLTLSLVAAACSETVLVRELEGGGQASTPLEPDGATAPTDGATADTGTPVVDGTAAPGALPRQTASPQATFSPVPAEKRCADGPGPDQGILEDEIVWGAILPLSGPTRPLGEQTARVMRRMVEYYNQLTYDPGNPSVEWGCPDRPGIFGRKIRLEIAAISSDSEDDVLAAMRRLIDVDKVFLVRDCYLQASLMGPGHAYAEDRGITTYQCYPESLPQPALAPHTFAPGTPGATSAALLVGHMINVLGHKRIALMYDPTYERSAGVVERVTEALGGEIVSKIEARAQTAVNGRRSEVIAMRQADPDGVIILDALNATYAGVAAGQLQWRPQDSGVTWACNKCWLKFQVDVCGENCAGMLTTTAGVPFEAYDEGSKFLIESKQRNLPNEPDDVLTYAAILITAGLVNRLALTGPDLTRAKFEAMLESYNGPPGAGIPPLYTGPNDHFGGSSDWIIEFTGRSWPNGFGDVSDGYSSLDDVGVSRELARS